MDAKQKQAEVWIMLGELFGPLRRIAEKPERYSAYERDRAISRYFHDAPKMLAAVSELAKLEPDHLHLVHNKRFAHAAGGFQANVQQSPDELASHLDKYYPVLRANISDMPISTSSVIIGESSPFQAYCTLKDLCATTRASMIWVDRYFDAVLFYRFLRDMDAAVNISVVTWPVSKRSGERAKTKFEELLDIAGLFATERRDAAFNLISHEDIHDRWLRCDDALYHLGGSAKDAAQGSDFSITLIDPSNENFTKLQHLIDTGTREI